MTDRRIPAAGDPFQAAVLLRQLARDARGVAELAAAVLSAPEREHRVEAFWDAAAFYAELADALEARLAAESGIRRLK